jgi:hypothetical protein
MMRDIRRTVATGLAELGVSANIISKIMDHTLPGESPVTPIYTRYAFLDEKRKALDSWGCHLDAHLRSQLPGRGAGRPSGRRLAAVPGRRQRAGA